MSGPAQPAGPGLTSDDDVVLVPVVMLMPVNHASGRRDVPVRLQGFVLDGARIGEGALLAAGGIVPGEVPSHEIWDGTPALKLEDRQ